MVTRGWMAPDLAIRGFMSTSSAASACMYHSAPKSLHMTAQQVCLVLSGPVVIDEDSSRLQRLHEVSVYDMQNALKQA